MNHSQLQHLVGWGHFTIKHPWPASTMRKWGVFMSQTFIDGFCLKLEGVLPPEEIRAIRELLGAYSIGYQISPIKTDLAVTDYQLPQAYYIYMASKEQDGRMAESSKKQYRMCLENMLFRMRMPLDQITVNHIRLYLHEISTNPKTGKKLSKATVNQRKAIIRSFFKWCYEEEYIQKDPSVRIKEERTDSKPRTAYKDTQIEAMRQACDSPRTRAIVDLLASSGIRVAECAGLNISDVDLDNRELTVFGKGGKWRTAFMDAAAVVSLKAYLQTRDDDSPALFVGSRKPHGRLSTDAIRRTLHKLSPAAGVEDVIPHRFRHTTATAAIERGMPIESVQVILGHSNISTTLRYAHVSKEKVKRDHSTYMR